MPEAFLLGLLSLCVLFLLGPILLRIKVKGAPQVLRDRVANYARYFGYSDYVVELLLAMSALESGRWTSNLYQTYNNPWGMKHPVRRPTTSAGPLSNGFAHYTTVDSAAKDIFLWLEYNNSPTFFWSLRDFVNWLQSKGYEGDLTAAEYYRRIKNAIA